MSEQQWMPPDTIYLVRDEPGPYEDHAYWCDERINDDDVEYSRVPAPGVPVEAIRYVAEFADSETYDDNNHRRYTAQVLAWLARVTAAEQHAQPQPEPIYTRRADHANPDDYTIPQPGQE